MSRACSLLTVISVPIRNGRAEASIFATPTFRQLDFDERDLPQADLWLASTDVTSRMARDLRATPKSPGLTILFLRVPPLSFAIDRPSLSLQ